MSKSFALSLLFGGFGFASAIIIAVWLSGSTFGQRCAVDHQKYSKAWTDCVDDLARGKRR